MFFEDYCQSAYGNQFEDLAANDKIKALEDLFDNKPTNFEGPRADELFNELYDMVVAGFWADPLYGGNKAMAGWSLIGFAGANNGSAQGYTTAQLMVMDHPVRLPPLSLSDIQRGGM